MKLPKSTELSGLERKTISALGGNPNKKVDVKSFFSLNLVTRSKHKRAVFEGKVIRRPSFFTKLIQPQTGLIQPQTGHRSSKSNQPLGFLKKGIKIKTKCDNCLESFEIWSCSQGIVKWCPACIVEINRLRARKRFRMLNPSHGKSKKPIKPIIRLTKKTIRLLRLE